MGPSLYRYIMSKDCEPEILCHMKSRTVFLTGEIDEVKTQDYREALLELYTNDPTQEITVFIDTYGGSTYAMFAMHDMMKMISCPIHTVGIGKVMSAGALLLAAGEARSLAPNAMVMLHQISTDIQGKLGTAKLECAHVELLQKRMYELYSLYTGKTTEEVAQDLLEDKYMTASEAIAYGLADSIYPFARKGRQNETNY